MVVAIFYSTAKRSAYNIGNFAKTFQSFPETLTQLAFKNCVFGKIIIDIYTLFNFSQFNSEEAKLFLVKLGYAKKGVASFWNSSYFATISSS